MGDGSDESKGSDDGVTVSADRETVSRTYDRIAEPFSETREYPWPEVTEFLTGRTGDVGLDLGCGNGRHLPLLEDAVGRTLGVDASPGLLSVAIDRARDRGYDERVAFVAGDAARIPVVDDAVDLALYVATLHHLPTRAGRVASLDELARVLAPGGVALVSAWSVAHDRFDRTSAHDATVDWTLPDGETVPRFYHVYDRAEFEADLERSLLAVDRSFVSSGNQYAVVGTP